MLESLTSLNSVMIHQRFEVAEFFGFETRNKYAIETEDGKPLAFVAEQQKGVLGFFFRQFLGHWRTFDILFFDNERRPLMTAHHPFRWIFQRIEVLGDSGQKIGALQQRFSLINKKFDVEGVHGEILMSVSSPIWRIWTFPFLRNNQEVARIEKKWSGFMAEAFTDKDKFRVLFLNEELSKEARMLLLAAGIFVDLQYFEKKQSASSFRRMDE